jgi:alanyl-tRNA synthetase
MKEIMDEEFNLNRQNQYLLDELCFTLNVTKHELYSKIQTLVHDIEQKELEIKELSNNIKNGITDYLTIPISEILYRTDIHIICRLIYNNSFDSQIIRKSMNAIFNKSTKDLILIDALFTKNDKISIMLGVSKNISNKYNAEKLIKQLCNDNGGGSSTMAHGGIDKKQFGIMIKTLFDIGKV